MSSGFWIKRTLTVFCLFFLVISVAHALRGHTPGDAAIFGLTWSSVSTVLFTAARLYQARRGMYCSICNDIPIK
jgi:hypothetical protein